MTCPRCGRGLAMAKIPAERFASIRGPQPLSIDVTYRYCPTDDLVVFVRDGVVIGHEGMDLP